MHRRFKAEVFCSLTAILFVIVTGSGNSGDPLVTSQGRVIGINTFKKRTHKFEALGFAISIKVALDAFDAI
jgi:S1-C subfamily serine protease